MSVCFFSNSYQYLIYALSSKIKVFKKRYGGKKTVEDLSNGEIAGSFKKLEKNEGISGNTNQCLEMATGEYIGLFDHDDILHPSALYEFAKTIYETDAEGAQINSEALQSYIGKTLFAKVDDVFVELKPLTRIQASIKFSAINILICKVASSYPISPALFLATISLQSSINAIPCFITCGINV